MSAIYTLGIDVGSTASKCIMLKDGQEIVAKSLIDVGAGTSGPQRAIDAVLENAGMKKEDMAFTLATGYGRNSLMNFADKQMSELSCHARGAYFLFPDVHTVIDIGGQDVKVLHVMAGVLEVKVQDLGHLDSLSKKRVEISSTCTVFAESEVISQLSMGTDKCDIIAGIHRSVAHRVTGLAHRIGVVPALVMTGGVAQNEGVVKALQNELGCEIHRSPLTQYNGALGAALYAYQAASRRA